MSLVAEARARTATPEALITRFRNHMAEHGLTVQGPVAESRIAFPGGVASLVLEGGGIALRIEAATPDWLADAKSTVAGHLEAFAPGEALDIVWRGEGEAAGGVARPHNFRTARVVAVTDVTPRMRRVTVTGEDLARFASDTAWHVKLLIPGTRTLEEPRWPVLSPSGQPVFEGCDLTRRTYTIRRIDPGAREIAMDFVWHGDGSPGSRFAAQAAPGDWLGITGPGGGHVPVQGWTLIGGDETALPAIARALETMPADSRGVVLIEIAGAAERQNLAPPPGMALHWLHRDGAAPGAKLLPAVQAVAWPALGERSAWVACEAATAQALRLHFAETVGLPRGRFRAAGYWRQGLAEGAEREEH
jgi:NADPH-dependent ferric siderophore reductase